MQRLCIVAVLLVTGLSGIATAQEIRSYPLERRDYPHDVAAASDGTVWFSGQKKGIAGRLDPATGKVDRIPLGEGAAPHGVIIGPDDAPWFTDGGRNAIVRVDPKSHAVKAWPLPPERMPSVDLNTAVFDRAGRIWFTGQNGVYGRLDPATGSMMVWDAPRGRGAYGITATPDGTVWFVSLDSSFLARIDPDSGKATIFEPPSPGRGLRRVWSDSKGRLWISEWNAGNLSVFDPATTAWKSWRLPGTSPQAYAVWVDADDKVWVSDWGANAILRFDPATETFEGFPGVKPRIEVRQMAGRKSATGIEAWIAESGSERLTVIRPGPQR